MKQATRALETILDLYDGAIAARANDFVSLAAVSEEAAGNFRLSRTRGHRIRAIQGYRDWGADRNAQELAATHGDLIASLGRPYA